MMREHPLRAKIDKQYRSVKVARGVGLYFADHQLIRASISDVRLFSSWADIERDDPGRSLYLLSDRDVTEPELILFEQGIRQMELGAPASAWASYERAVRERCAVCLREGRGGGALFACWAAMAISLREVE